MPSYFKAADGRIATRFGTTSKIAAVLVRNPPKPGVPGPGTIVGYKQDLARVVLIPDQEIRKFRREYINAVRRGDLLASTEAEYNQFVTGTAPAPTAGPSGPEGAPPADSTPTGPSDDPAPALAPTGADAKELDGGGKVASEPKTSQPTRKRRRSKS